MSGGRDFPGSFSADDLHRQLKIICILWMNVCVHCAMFVWLECKLFGLGIVKSLHLLIDHIKALRSSV